MQTGIKQNSYDETARTAAYACDVISISIIANIIGIISVITASHQWNQFPCMPITKINKIKIVARAIVARWQCTQNRQLFLLDHKSISVGNVFCRSVWTVVSSMLDAFPKRNDFMSSFCTHSVRVCVCVCDAQCIDHISNRSNPTVTKWYKYMREGKRDPYMAIAQANQPNQANPVGIWYSINVRHISTI